MDTVRLGIIGLGNAGAYHADYLLQEKVSRCRLVAVCSRKPAAAERYPSLRVFADAQQLIDSGEIDAVIIATPPFTHAPLASLALRAGVHAMVEKPLTAHVADAHRLIAVQKQHPQTLLAGMFQLRVEPRYQKIRQLIAGGELGELVRVNWINTDWYRTQAYYASSAWRATWKGEGGGVLLNQRLHNVDILQWLCSMPDRVRGFCNFGRFHQIEVEDDATAYLEWAGGATGVFIGSTGEARGTNRLELTGTLGRLVLENDRLSFARNEVDMLQFSRSADKGFAKPPAREEQIPFDNAVLPHATVMQNFVNAILDGEPLIAPADQGIHSVELANAIVFSSMLAQPIALPMDAAAWERKLNELIAESTHHKPVMQIESDDFAASFRK